MSLLLNIMIKGLHKSASRYPESVQLCAQPQTVKVTPPFTSLPDHRFHIQTVFPILCLQLLPNDMMLTCTSTTCRTSQNRENRVQTSAQR